MKDRKESTVCTEALPCGSGKYSQKSKNEKKSTMCTEARPRGSGKHSGESVA
jgi:hypothetical protein